MPVSKVTPFPAHARARELKEFMVSVTTIMPWRGLTPDHAADEAAKALGHVQQDTADFYGDSYMVWGPISEENPPSQS